jgi:hypothetical protein
MIMKIYITGKVTGEPIAECTMKFGMAQKAIEDLGHEAINPLSVVNDWHTTWKAAMRKCIAALMEADAIYLLPCSKHSKGAKMEMELAAALSIPMYTTLHWLK